MKTSKVLYFAALGCGSALSAPQLAVAQQSPNVIYILADDLGIGDIGCYGQTKILTPNIDKLANDGMLFTQHYSGSTVSAPSRCVLLTGLHTGHSQIRANKELQFEGQTPLEEETYTLATLFKERGYSTAAFGKWGLGYPGSSGDPINVGFDEFFGYNCQRQAHRYYPQHLWHNDKKVILEGNDTKNKVVFAPDLIHERTLEFIEENAGNPFFAYVSIIQPHAELIAPEDEILAFYDGKFLETPYVGQKAGDEYGSADFKESGYCSQPKPRATFAAMVARIDKYVGEIVEKLEQEGIAENTIIIFSSDNGAHQAGGADPDFFDSNAEFRGYKRSLTDGGIRTPMLVKWSGVVEAGSTSDHISAFWDVMPTFADILNVDVSSKSNGISMLPTLRSKGKQRKHEALYWEHRGEVAVRVGNWKGICYGMASDDNAPIELYDIIADVDETNDVSASHPKVVNRIREIMSREHTPNKTFPLTLSERK